MYILHQAQQYVQKNIPRLKVAFTRVQKLKIHAHITSRIQHVYANKLSKI